MNKTKVVNRHFDKYNIYIGRGTKWGNPFMEFTDGNHDEVIELYRQYAQNNPNIYNHIHELKGKILGCSCKPRSCHGDILVEMVENIKMYDKLVIGIDQSYTRTGIGLSIDRKLLKVSSISFKGCKNKTDKRRELARVVKKIIEINQYKAKEIVIICERIRTFSNGKEENEPKEGKKKGPKSFISTDYIKATGALIATIVDVAYKYDIPVYSVATNSWKAQVLGSSKSKGQQGKKTTSVNFIMKLGHDISSVNRAGNIVYDDDGADAGCISLYGHLPESRQKLKLEQ